MSRKVPPRYPNSPHKSGQARLKSGGKTYWLGKFGTPESHLKYQQVLADWHRANTQGPAPRPTLTTSQVTGLFLAAARSGERPTSAKELSAFTHAAAAIDSAGLGARLAEHFDADSLDAVRRWMVGQGWARRTVCRQCVRIRTIFRFAERRRLVPAGTWEQLRTLQLGTGQVNDTVPPVPEADLTATLAQLGRIPRAMVEVQLLTGMRPGELVRLTPGMIRRNSVGGLNSVGGVWIADFGLEHKTGWRGHKKLVLIGPRAQQILLPFLDRPADTCLFQPCEAMAEFRAKQRQHRQTKVQPSQEDRSKRWPRKKPGSRYSVRSYERAIERACRRAKVPRWSPGQLRHNAASRLAAEFGPEVARIVLGHSDLATTRTYVQDSLAAAIQAMEKAG